MGDQLRQRRGSPSRDLFKQLHKSRLPRHFFACDLDLTLIEKRPYGVVAYTDFKLPSDSITFTEVILYNELRQTKPVYIIEAAGLGELEAGRLTIREYLGGDPQPNPPIVNLGSPVTVASWGEFAAWQQYQRDRFKNGGDA